MHIENIKIWEFPQGNQSGSVSVEDNQYQVDSDALADRNFNIACETGISHPSLVAMLNSWSMLWRATVIYHAGMYILVRTEYTPRRMRPVRTP